MSKRTLYGTSQSRALRSVWAIEETGIDYHHVPTHYFNDSKTPEYLAVNPNGRIPALVDGDLGLAVERLGDQRDRTSADAGGRSADVYPEGRARRVGDQ